jgi:hypothetical protein
METSEAEFENAVTIAIDWRDGEALSEAINKCASYCGKEVQSWEAFPERTFKFLIELFAQDCIVEFDGAYHLFLIFRHEWSRLSDLQRRKLMSLLNNACTKPMAAMTRFVICELLGEFYANAESLDLLKQFGMMQSEDSRLFVPHGLELGSDRCRQSHRQPDPKMNHFPSTVGSNRHTEKLGPIC